MHVYSLLASFVSDMRPTFATSEAAPSADIFTIFFVPDNSLLWHILYVLNLIPFMSFSSDQLILYTRKALEGCANNHQIVPLRNYRKESSKPDRLSFSTFTLV